jgi:transcription elongation factor GreA
MYNRTDMQKNGEQISKEKYKELVNELDFLKTTRRKEIAEQLEYARSLGDLSENAEYKEARDHQADLEDRINEIDAILQNAIIITGHSHSKVTVGCTVTILKKGTKTEQSYSIVSPSEADAINGKVSYESPLGSAMMNKKKGDTFVFNAPKGKIEYTIEEIK